MAVVVAGATPPNPTKLLESEEMVGLIEDLGSRYDLIVIDTPPLSIVADAIPLITRVDGAIVVASIGKTTRDEAIHLRDQLRKLDAPTLGVIANRARSSRGYAYYYGDAKTRRLPSFAKRD
jgi:Mrp family chromosome partitioning ATPase